MNFNKRIPTQRHPFSQMIGQWIISNGMQIQYFFLLDPKVELLQVYWHLDLLCLAFVFIRPFMWLSLVENKAYINKGLIPLTPHERASSNLRKNQH